MATTASDILAAVDNPNVRKFRDMLAQAEGVKHGYATGFGNKPLDSLDDHPRTQSKFTQTDGKQNTTSAAGRYQVLQKTWDGLRKQFPNEMPDFSEASQDFAATALLKNAGALKDIVGGDFTSGVKKVGSIWASLPSSPYKQNKRSWSDISGYLGETVSGGGGGAPVVSGVSTKDQNRLFLAYKSGAMNEQQAADYLRDVEAGFLNMPKNAKVAEVKQPKKLAAAIMPDDLMIAYNDGTLSGKPRTDFETDYKAGRIVAPEGITFALDKPIQPQAQPTTLLGDIGQGVSNLGSSIIGDGGIVDVVTGIPKAVYGAGEAVVGGGLGMAKEAAKGIYGTASGLAGLLPQAIGGGGGFEQGYEQGSQSVENLIPSPQMATNAGAAVQQIMGAPAAELHRGGGAIGQGVENLTGSQTLGGLAAAGTETLGNALMLGLPLKGRIAPEVIAGEQARASAARQVSANPPIERAAPQAAEVAPIVEPVAPRTAAEKLDADIAAYQAERAAQQPLAASPEGLAAQAETMQAPAVEVGKPAIHSANGVETPVVVKNIEQQAGSDGKTYARVEHEGKDTIVPVEELTPIAEKPAQTAPIEPVTPLSAVEPMTASETVGLPLQELASKARTSTEGVIGKKSAQEVLAEQAAPSRPVVEAAERLGMLDDLQPDHFTTNQSFRELSQAIKSYTGSPMGVAEKAGLERAAVKADKIIEEIGATKDVSSLSQKIKDDLHAMVGELQARANGLYESLKTKIVQKDQVSAPETMAFIEERALTMAGAQHLTKFEKMVQAKLSDKSKPTYARLDDVRRELTAAKYKKEGAFGEADSWMIDQLLTRLNKDQRTAIETLATRNGLDGKALIAEFDLAQQTAGLYKSVQGDMVRLFGKQLDGNIASALKNGIHALARGDIKTFANLIKAVPESMRSEAVANGLAYAFDKNLGAINHNTFANFWNGIKRQGEANKLLKQYLPEQAYKALDDLGLVSESISKASKERIVTGRLNVVNETLKEADTMIGKLYEKAKAGAGAAIGAEAISASAGAPGVGIAIGSVMALLKDKPPIHLAIDNLLGSKEFRDMIATKSKMEALRGQK